jgi:hypothetical protein
MAVDFAKISSNIRWSCKVAPKSLCLNGSTTALYSNDRRKDEEGKRIYFQISDNTCLRQENEEYSFSFKANLKAIDGRSPLTSLELHAMNDGHQCTKFHIPLRHIRLRTSELKVH